MRALARLLLSLCFILLKGYGHLYAHTGQDCCYFAPAKITPPSAAFITDNIESRQALISKPTSPNTKRPNYKSKATEVDDDDESTSSRKHIECSNYITFFYAQTPVSIHDYQKKRLPLYNHFCYFSSPKFIVHRTIRI